MIPPPMPAITALYAALIAVILLVLALRVSSFRIRAKINLGHGGNPRRVLAVLAAWDLWAFVRTVLAS
jgi:uncharacterized membrane protein YecN with MAPEG domain